MSIKYCKRCGKELKRKIYNGGRVEYPSNFNRRIYCDRMCANTSSDPNSFSKQKRKANIHKKSSCDKCGSNKQLCVHHIDLNRNNNNPDNLMTLCTSCHSKWHWKNGDMDGLIKNFNCKICNEPALDSQLCRKHLYRYRTHGDPLLKMIQVNNGGKPGRYYKLFRENPETHDYEMVVDNQLELSSGEAG